MIKFQADIARKLKRAKARVGPLLWQKAMSKDENKKKKTDDEREEEKSQSKRNKGLDTSFLRKASDSRVVVAALVPTVSFAAGSNLPGGYRDSDGMAILSNKPSFQAFVLADSLALVLSVGAVLCHFYTALSTNKKRVIILLISARWLTKLGVGAMVIAFMTNLYSVLPDSSAIVLFALYFCLLLLSLCFVCTVKFSV